MLFQSKYMYDWHVSSDMFWNFSIKTVEGSCYFYGYGVFTDKYYHSNIINLFELDKWYII